MYVCMYDESCNDDRTVARSGEKKNWGIALPDNVIHVFCTMESITPLERL
jgi:hypothetical protein